MCKFVENVKLMCLNLRKSTTGFGLIIYIDDDLTTKMQSICIFYWGIFLKNF